MTILDTPHAAPVAGIDIGGTTTHAVLLDGDGRMIANRSAATPAQDGGAAMVESACRLVDDLSAELWATAGRRIGAVGVGAAGVIDWPAGSVATASDSFKGWGGFPLATRVAQRLGVRALADNDVNAFLLGEATWGQAHGCRNVLGITLGTGVGGALLLDGELYRGSAGWAGEIGHVAGFSSLLCTCGQVGHLETMAAGRAIVSRYATATTRTDGAPGNRADPAPMPLSAADIAARARAGDLAALQVFADAGAALGKALALAGSLLDVTDAVIGGGLVGAWDLIEPALAHQLAEVPPVSGHAPAVRTGSLGTLAVARGAASLVLTRVPAAA